MNAGWFKRGQLAWNKGLKGSTGFSESRFKKGNIPHHRREIGEERIDHEGYTYTKISCVRYGYKDKFWRLKHREIWESVHGEIPPNSIICFYDNNKQNFEISNLFRITRAENVILNKLKFASEPVEIKPSIIALVRLQIAVKELAKKKDKRASYTPEQIEFLKGYPLLDRAVLAEKFNARFGTTKSIAAIRNYCRNGLGMRMPPSGQFKKGSLPINAGKKGFCFAGSEKGWFKKGHAMNEYEVGTEFMKEGTIFIKYTDEHKLPRHNFAPKHRVIWRKYNGEIGRDDLIIFKDGNRLNCTIENLERVDRGVFMKVAKEGFLQEPVELRPTILAVAKLSIKAKKITSERGINDEKRVWRYLQKIKS